MQRRNNVGLMESMEVRQLINNLEATESELARIKLQHFLPVDESVIENNDPRYRKNRLIINANFDAIDLHLKLINVGAHPNDATGDPIRDAWIKVNENFSYIKKYLQEDESEG